ncbi:acyl-CoA reductase [Methylotetracoccus oryzae]|uniref:acyl-CoA reductase n=1 Tax=Methylotetracoccus oryzae TaxID=1919059 RepID=UPI001118A613|nr:acyl-CoA reductase [Methylotetracoccus oryzae]
MSSTDAGAMNHCGECLAQPATDDQLITALVAAREGLVPLASASLEDTLRMFEVLQSLWLPGGEFFARAAEPHPGTPAGSSQFPVARLMSRQRWEQRLSELPTPVCLDRAVRWRGRMARAFPLGLVVHSLPAGGALDLVDSTLACLLTHNAPVLWLPDECRHFAALFLASLQRADPHGVLSAAVAAFAVDEKRRAGLFTRAQGLVDAFVDWSDGGRTVGVQATGRRRIARMPPVLVGVVSRAYWNDCDRRRLIDILRTESRWREDSSAAALDTVYVEAGVDLAAVLDAEAGSHSALTRMPSFKAYVGVDDLAGTLAALPRAAACCVGGLGSAERGAYLERIGRHFRRFVSFNAFPDEIEGRLSDGGSLRELVHVMEDDEDGGVADLLRDVSQRVPYYRDARPEGEVSRLDRWPLLTAADLAREPVYCSRRFLHEQVAAGAIFSSGGTSTAPKYALYTPDEIARSTEMLAQAFRANGLRPGDIAINLFVAGHLWSAFLAVDEALRRCGVYVLPMGGSCPVDEIVSCIARFRPQVAFGLPSLLVGYARHCESAGIDLVVERIFYAGEHFNAAAREYLSRIWKTRSFHSAGYAAVDVGPIGWQCAHCHGGEHHLFSRDVHLEVIDEEAVVTSLLRRAMPVVRYRTGDRVEWVTVACPCGSPDPRFRLLGRVDNVINIWGCRVAYEDVERALLEAGLEAPALQLVVRERVGSAAHPEQLLVRLERVSPAPGVVEAFIRKLHRYSGDLAVALDVNSLRQRVAIECLPPGTLPRIERTGKIRLIVDERACGQA